jgi:hypothetical protein
MIKYKNIMINFDQCNVRRVVVLILWNNEDPETLANRGRLKHEVFGVFQKRPSKPDYFRESIESKQALLDELAKAMQRAMIDIIQSSDVERKLEPGPSIVKPVIHGPGGKP